MNLNLTLMLYNATGLRKKSDSIKKYMNENNIDFCLITETWVKNIDFIPKGLVAPSVCSGQSLRGQAGTGFFINEEKWRGKVKIISTDCIRGLYSIIELQNIIIVVVYFPPSLDIQEITDVYSQIFEKIESKNDKQLIIGGDFNCKLPQLNDGYGCARGKWLNTEMSSRGLCLQNISGEYTNFVPCCNPTIIDLWWTDIKNPKNCIKVETEKYLGRSSHRPVILKVFDISGISPNEITKRKVIRLERLKDSRVKEAFKELITPEIKSFTRKIADELVVWRSVDGNKNDCRANAAIFNTNLESNLSKLIDDATKKVCGTRTVIYKKGSVVENSTTISLTNHINALTKLIIKNPSNDHLRKRRDELIIEQEKSRELIKAKAFNDFDLSVAKLRKCEQQKLFKKIVKSKIGNNEIRLDNSAESLKNAEKYFSSLYRNEKISKKHNGFDWTKLDDNLIEMAKEIFSEEIISEFCKWAPAGKAPGISGITNECIRAIGPELISMLVEWFQFCFITGSVPKGWQKAVIVPIFKKGEKTLIKNYRPIALLENFRKLYEKCLEKYIRETMAPLEILQGGFQAKKGTLDQVSCLQNILMAYKKTYKKFPVLCFLDIKAAYDSVDRYQLFNDCVKKDIPIQVVESIRQLFDFNSANVRIQNNSSSSFTLPCGVQQGSILSPLLYSIFIEKIIIELKKGPGLNYEKQDKANCLLYADDIVLISKTQKEMNSLLKIADGVASRKNFQFNIDKCAYVYDDKIKLWLDEKKIEKVEVFIYLGIRFNSKGIDNISHINELKQKMERTVSFFKRIGFNGKGYRLGSKVTFYKSFIRSKLEYGLAIMDLNKKERKLIEQIQYDLICQLFNVNKKTSYKMLQVITGLTSMHVRIDILKAKWILRYNYIKENDYLLSPKIEKWCNEQGIMTVMNTVILATVFEFTDTNYKKENKDLHDNYFKGILQETNFSKKCDVVRIEALRIQKLLNGKIGSKNDIQIICLYLLNKFPCKPSMCNICKNKLASDHLVICNKNIWIEFVNEIKNKYQNSNSYPSINVSINEIDALIPYKIMKFLSENSKQRVKHFVIERFAHCIKSSFILCYGDNSNF